MKEYLLVSTKTPSKSRFVPLGDIGQFMWGKVWSKWMVLEIDEEAGTKKYIPWPEQFGCVTEMQTKLEEILREAIYS